MALFDSLTPFEKSVFGFSVDLLKGECAMGASNLSEGAATYIEKEIQLTLFTTELRRWCYGFDLHTKICYKMALMSSDDLSLRNLFYISILQIFINLYSEMVDYDANSEYSCLITYV